MVKGRTSTLAGSAAETLLTKIKAGKMMLLKKRNTVFFFIRKIALLLVNRTSLTIDGIKTGSLEATCFQYVIEIPRRSYHRRGLLAMIMPCPRRMR
jgi:hypothetical protein